MMNRPIFVWVAGLVALVAGVFVALAPQPPKPKVDALWLEAPRLLPDVSLVDHQGNEVGLDYFKDGWTLLFIGYTSCPDVCPMTLGDLARVYPKLEQRLGSKPIQVVLLSVDPARDKPERLAQYMEFFRPGFGAITGEHRALLEITQTLGLAYAMVDNPNGEYLVDHSADIALINPDAELEALFRPVGDIGEVRRVSMSQLEQEVPLILGYTNPS